MPTLPFRCLNPDCSTADTALPKFDFDSVEPVCPKCGIDGRTPDGATIVHKLAVIHLLLVDKAGSLRMPYGGRRLACDPSAKRIPTHCTGEPNAVTCPACKATDEHKSGQVQHHDLIITQIANRA